MAEEQFQDQQARAASAKSNVISQWPNATAHQESESGAWAIFVMVGQTLGTRKWHASEAAAWIAFPTDYPTRSLAGRKHTREQLRKAAGDQVDAVDEALKRAESAEREVAAIRIEATRSLCVWCGYQSDPSPTREERDNTIAAHIMQCVTHPMNKALRAMCAAEQNLLTGRSLLDRLLKGHAEDKLDGLIDEIDEWLADSRELPAALFPQYTRNQLELQYRDLLGALRYGAGAYVCDGYKVNPPTEQLIADVMDIWLTRVQPAVAAANEIAVARAEGEAGK